MTVKLLKRLDRWDKRAFDAVAGAQLPGLHGVLPGLSAAADRALLWGVVAGCLIATGQPRLRRAGVRGLLAISVASPLTNLVGKQIFRRSRPLADLIPLVRRRPVPASWSFPSGHSASAAAFATAVGLDAPLAVAVPVGVLAAAVAFSRVYVGAHYPGDVVTGVALGATAGWYASRSPLSLILASTGLLTPADQLGPDSPGSAPLA